MPWNTIKNEDDRPLLEYQLEKVVRGFFDPELFLDYVRYFVLFEDDGDSLIKKIAGYHQFHGVREAVCVTTIAADDTGVDAFREGRTTCGDKVQPGSRKLGVFWHTQGSGKSISMCCYAGKLLLQSLMKNRTLVVVTGCGTCIFGFTRQTGLAASTLGDRHSEGAVYVAGTVDDSHIFDAVGNCSTIDDIKANRKAPNAPAELAPLFTQYRPVSV